MKDWIIQILYAVVIEVLFGVAFKIAPDSFWISLIIFFIGNVFLEFYVDYRKKHDTKNE